MPRQESQSGRSSSLAAAEGQLSVESLEYLKRRPKSERSPLGQFLTPRFLREELASRVNISPGMRILDPGVGTGEFLRTCIEIEPTVELHGWDIDAQVLDVARVLVPEAVLERRSALAGGNEQFDVVIGNPPYFEIRNLAPELKSKYANVIQGRPNIFSLFFQAGLELVKDGGCLAFVVPPSMNNGAYFENLRKTICSHGSIEYLKVYDNPHLFIDAQTSVQLIVIRKGFRSSAHQVELHKLCGSGVKRTIFVENVREFRSRYRGKSSLFQLGYTAVTGSVVWNQKKDDLRDIPSDDTVPLLWAHNITSDDEIQLFPNHPKRKQYIRHSNRLVGPAIILNRITGSVGSGTLRCAFIPAGFEFIGENHVNVIKARTDSAQLVSWKELLNLLRAPTVTESARELTGNTQISATELTHWIPL